MNIFITYLQAIILSALTLSIPFVGAGLVKLVVILYKYLTTKYGVARTNQIASEALKLWHSLDEETRLGNFIGDKYNTFMIRMQAKFPLLTQDRIYEFNKDIAGQVNASKAKVIEAIKVPDTIVLPIYKNANGETLVLEKPTV